MIAIKQQILQTTGADKIISEEAVQSLWSDYGEIRRYILAGGKYPSVIVKHIQLPDFRNHPKGWNTAISHERKLSSYQIESRWYEDYAELTNSNCRVPVVYYSLEQDQELLIIMEDLDASGYPLRLDQTAIDIYHIKSCLSWLANLHAIFMDASAEGLWPIGSYWHLATRQEELKKMKHIPLKNAAKKIDERLNKAKYQTIIHGDAKLANFCFAKSGHVAAVDFQYVGKGCGMKDVAYFISSCLDEADSAKYEAELLQHYFDVLDVSITDEINFPALKEEWSALYPYAWADFYRFLDGWNPGHYKMHAYSKSLTEKVLNELGS